MKCRKHPEDDSSASGLCATCLRQRLIALIAAQAAQGDHFKEDDRESDANPTPSFPRSVSPYINRRRPDSAPPTEQFRRRDHMDGYNCLPDRKFFSTPQVGPPGRVIDDHIRPDNRKGNRKFWLFSGLFRSKSALATTDSDPRASRESRESRSWFSILSRRKQLELEVSTHRNHARGMSPAACSEEESEPNCSGRNTEELKQTPRRTPARHVGGRRSHLSRNVSDIVFCLSPLVRPSPGRVWNQKGGLPPEIGVSSEARVPVKTASFCKNGSRKLADFGRCKRNH